MRSAQLTRPREVSQSPPNQGGLPGSGIQSRLHLVLSGKGCLLDLDTCIELGDRCEALHLLLRQPRERGLWRVLTLLEPTLWPPFAPLLAEFERLPSRRRSLEVVSLGRSSTTPLFCESFSISATVREVLLVCHERVKTDWARLGKCNCHISLL